MDISVIIPNYKSELFLVDCIKSIQASFSSVSFEIIVINNDIIPITKILSFDNIRIVDTKENMGFARACNAGAKIAGGDILFFLNPDTKIISGDIHALIKTINTSSVGVVSPQLLTSSGVIQPWSAGYEITLLEIISNNIGIIKSSNLWKKNTKHKPDWISGAAMLIKKDLFNKINGFDENFFMYFEDVDICKRVKDASLDIVISPLFQVLHFGGQSSSGTKQQKKFYYTSQDYYFKKHQGIISLFFLKMIRTSLLLFTK
jgi:GT2 family glycosyltransferase